MDTDTTQVASFYDQYPSGEHARLEENPIEYIVTWTAIQQTVERLKNFTAGSLRILDIGGGTGRYAVQLAKLGHEVVLSDISSSELEIAQQYASENNVSLAQVVTADARDLRKNADLFKPNHYDLVLCLGPFYHLLSKVERLQLLKDLIDTTQPNGYILAAFVTMFAHLRDVAKKDPTRLLREAPFYSAYIQTGQYTRTMPMHHTHSSEIRKLFKQVEQDLSLERYIGCESFLVGRMSATLKNLSKEEFKPWAEVAIRFAEDPEAAGGADHILTVSRKK